MTRGEKILLMVGAAMIVLLAMVTALNPEPRASRRWGVCSGDVERQCADPSGKGAWTTRVLKCLGANHAHLAGACQQLMEKDYPALLQRSGDSIGTGVTGAEEAAPAFDVEGFLLPCRSYWTPECVQLSDQTGENVSCFVAQANFDQFSEECRAVMVEIVQWTPKECVDAPVFARCQSLWGRKRLECFLRLRDQAPASCERWMQAVEKIAR